MLTRSQNTVILVCCTLFLVSCGQVVEPQIQDNQNTDIQQETTSEEPITTSSEAIAPDIDTQLDERTAEPEQVITPRTE